VCESSDVFGKNVSLPETGRGDLLAIRSCGAYAESMMLRYNMRTRAKSHFLSKGEISTACHKEQRNGFASPVRVSTSN